MVGWSLSPLLKTTRSRKNGHVINNFCHLGELVYEHVRGQSNKYILVWSSMNQFSRDLLFRDDHAEDDPLRPWRETLQLLPSQGDVLILIDEIDGLEGLWHTVFNDEVESGTLVHALWDAVLMLRNKQYNMERSARWHLCGTRLSSATIPSRLHARGLSKSIIGFSSHSKHPSARVVTRKNPENGFSRTTKLGLRQKMLSRSYSLP